MGEGRRSPRAGRPPGKGRGRKCPPGPAGLVQSTPASQEPGRVLSWAPRGAGPAPGRGTAYRHPASRVRPEAWGWVTGLDVSRESDTRVQRTQPAAQGSRPGPGLERRHRIRGRLGAGGSAWAQGHPAVLAPTFQRGGGGGPELRVTMAGPAAWEPPSKSLAGRGRSGAASTDWKWGRGGAVSLLAGSDSRCSRAQRLG